MSKLTISYDKFLDIITKLYQNGDGYVQYQPEQTELANKEQGRFNLWGNFTSKSNNNNKYLKFK